MRTRFQQLLLAVLLLSGAAPFCASQQPYTTPHAPLLGSAWYPEQWPEDRWDADLALMEQAHMNVVRIGEFAWSTLEPREGSYQLDWMQRAIDLAAKHHLAVVIGTPTDAPPAWLTVKYPETLGVNADGRTREHGARRQFNYANPRYREFCREIVAQLGRRFGHNPAVIGWQIGNEYTDESFDPATRRRFQDFLRTKYGTLASLNQHWATAYWSQTYTDWTQIPLEATHGNPGLLLEHRHFVTATWRSFQRNQIDTLRQLIATSQFITTNIGGLAWSDNWDHYAISADLDLASWDDYVGEGHLDATKNAMLNDFVRGWRRQNFWVMETQPGSVNWAPINNALYPGETRALAWQTVGHGADAVLYWQWRAALNGQEQYHGAIIGPDGEPLPLYSEIKQLGEEFERAQPYLAGTAPQSKIALLHTYDSRWAIDFQQHSKDYDQQKILQRFYKPLQELAASRGEAVDIIDPTQAGSLAQYKLLVAPSLNVIDDALANKLLAWVRAGGTLVLGPRSGMKDAFNALDPHRQPGPLAETLGAKVEQFYALDKPAALQAIDSLGEKMNGGTSPTDVQAMPTSDTWAESLAITSLETKTLFSYRDPNGWLDGKPAMVLRDVGKGKLVYLGTLPGDIQLWRIFHFTLTLADIWPYNGPQDGIEICYRGSGESLVAIVINHNPSEAEVNVPFRARALFGAAAVSDTFMPTTVSATHVVLPPEGVAVLVRKERP